MKKIFALFTFILFITPVIIHIENVNGENIIPKESESLNLNRILNEDLVIIPDSNPFFGIIGSYIACWYDIDSNITGLLPLLVQHNEKLSDTQELFLDQYLKNKDDKLMVLGEQVDSKYETIEILGSPPTVAINAAKQVFAYASTVMIIPYQTEDSYQLSLIASPLASYLNIPILIFDDNQDDIINTCKILNVSNAFVIGDIKLSLPNIFITQLETEAEIQNIIASTIKNKFNGINYITITNPSDTIPSYVIDSDESNFIDNIKNIRLTILGKEINLLGTGIKEYKIKIPNGINRVKIHGNIIKKIGPLIDRFNPIEPVLNMRLYDPQGKTVAYSNSFAYDIGETYLETLTCNASGDYTLVVRIYYGIKGGYFVSRGLSLVNTDVEISVNISTLEKPHMPLIPKLSITAPYLTSAHGGVIVADPDFEITSDDYTLVANGFGTGPWFEEKLHNFTNQKVNYTLKHLHDTLSILRNNSILDDYLNGPAWLAILGGTNMIPMYYYGPSQGIPEKGLPSDNPYSLDWNLSVSRVIGWNVQDVSVLISRTLFYQDIVGKPSRPRDWHNRFSFIFGEGLGETGGIFHQIPYSFEIRKYGFKPRIFGDFKNSRQMGVLLKTYTGSNYIEYLGHGDWYWFPASLYGLDSYSNSIDVAHVKDWIFDKPSVFLSSACLMGRIDGLPPEMNIGLAFLHAGCNAFIGSGRETGSEASLEPIENHLIIDDFSLGEAFRGGKRIDKDLPSYYVKTLFGDPAFNPYEPNNGFSNQGRPTFK
jgi:hypothetical protein